MAAEFQPMLKPLRDDSPPPSGPPLEAAPRVLSAVPGFWGRLGALVIDGAALTTLFYLAAHYAYDALYPYRWTAQVASALIVYAYFWIGSSALTQGQTLGKWVFGYRVVGEDGAPLPLGRAAARGAFVFLVMVAFAFRHNPPRVPHLTPLLLAVLVVLQCVSTAYSAGAGFFCGLHPKRRAPHDLWVRSVVVRSADAARGLDYVGDWSDTDRSRLKLAMYPAVLAALIVAFFFVSGFAQGRVEIVRAFATVQALREQLPSDGFHLLGFDPPSAAGRAAYAKRLAERREHQPVLEQSGRPGEAEIYAAATSQLERYSQNGERFIVFLDCDDTGTTESLVADPRYQSLIETLPAIAENFMRSPEGQEALAIDGKPTSWTLSAVQAEFYEALPLGLYVRTRGSYVGLRGSPVRWRVVLPATASSATEE